VVCPSVHFQVPKADKRKWTPTNESSQKNKKAKESDFPTQIQSVEQPEKKPANVAVVQPMQSDSSRAVSQTWSISQIDKISLTVYSAQSSLSAEESHDQPIDFSTDKVQSVSSSPKIVQPTVPQPKVVEAGNTYDQSKEISPAKAHTDSSSPQVVELSVPEHKIAEFKVAAEIVQQKFLEPEKSATVESAVFLRPHLKSVRCLQIYWPCAFTAAEDGTVHIYDLKTNSLCMQLLDHKLPVNFLFGITMSTSHENLSTPESNLEYLKNVTLITGCEDKHIRRFGLTNGLLISKKNCGRVPTCVVGSQIRTDVYVGTTEGTVFSYDPQKDIISMRKFKVS
jgi:WD40 repeat protein